MDPFASTNSSSCVLPTDKDLVKYTYIRARRLTNFFAARKAELARCQSRVFGELTSVVRRTPDHTSGPYIHISIALEAAQMSQRKSNYWNASDDSDTDAADAADLAEQPESTDEHKRVDIQFPELQRIKPRKLSQLKTDLRNKFNISEIEENSRTCVLSVSGYGFDHEDVLRVVRRYDSKAS